MSVCTPHWSVAPSTFETQLDTASGTLPNEFRSTIFGPWSPGLRPSTFSKADAAAAHVEEAHQGVPLLVDADAVFILCHFLEFGVSTKCLRRGDGRQLSVFTVIEGSLEVKLPTIWTDEKQSREEAERRERLEERRSEKRKIRREKIKEEKESEERRCRCAKR